MSLTEHIYELRTRLLICIAAIVLAGVLAFIFYLPVFTFLTKPYCELDAAHRLGGEHCTLVVTGIFDAFAVRLKVAFFVGIVLASPVWLYQLWAFITPGLYRNERRWALTFVAISLGLFAFGAALAYATLGKALAFLLSFAGDLTPLISIDHYLSFVTTVMFVFGLSFEFPLIVGMLNMAGVVSYAKLKSWRRAEIFGVFLFAALITPSQDPITMSAMAVPMCLFYEVALQVARVHDKRKAQRLAAAGLAELPDDVASPLAALDPVDPLDPLSSPLDDRHR